MTRAVAKVEMKGQRIGSPLEPIALAGYFLAAVGNPLMGLATVWQVVFAGRLLDRLGAGTRSAPRDALIASSVSAPDRGRAFGLEGVGDNAGACLGPLLAVLLLYGLHVGIRTIFYLAAIQACWRSAWFYLSGGKARQQPRRRRSTSACGNFRSPIGDISR